MTSAVGQYQAVNYLKGGYPFVPRWFPLRKYRTRFLFRKYMCRFSESVSFSGSMKVLKSAGTVSEQSQKAGLLFSNLVDRLQFQMRSVDRRLLKKN